MNYYERHLGDYAKDTAHLSMIEHGAYNLLLDRYYSTDAGIPADQVHRLSRARSKEEKKAVNDVLSEFFTLVDGIWTHRRADEEIAKTQRKITAAMENGKKGGRPKTIATGSEKETQAKPTGLFVGSEKETQKKALQTPDSIHQVNLNPLASSVPISTGGTPAGAVCARLRSEAKIADAAPHNPKLTALLEAGLTEDEIVAAGMDAKGKGFAWVLATAEGRRRDADKVKPLPTAKPSRHGGFENIDYRDGITAEGRF